MPMIHLPELESDDFDDDESDGTDDNLVLLLMIKYSVSCDPVKAVRGLHHNS